MHFADADLAAFSLKYQQMFYLCSVEKKISLFELHYSAMNLFCPFSFILLGRRGPSLLASLYIAITLHIEMRGAATDLYGT